MRIGFYCPAASYANFKEYEAREYPANGKLTNQLIGFLCAM